jgi:hypothetical protein
LVFVGSPRISVLCVVGVLGTDEVVLPDRCADTQGALDDVSTEYWRIPLASTGSATVAAG